MKNIRIKSVKMGLSTLLLPAVLMLTGCASIINGTHENIEVMTPPVQDAHCELTNDKGKWSVDSTPNTVTVHRAYGPLTVRCNKKGYKTSTRVFQSSTKSMAFGNIIAGGIIGGGVDAADGAAYDYPDTVAVPMKQA